MNSNPKALIIATSRKTRGGITTVLQAHENSRYWTDFQCYWLETHIDKNKFVKLAYFFRAFFRYLFIIHRYDIVHIHTSEPASAARKLPFALMSKLLRKRTIVHLHSFSPDTTVNGKWGCLYKILAKAADKVILLSEQARLDFCGEKIPVEKTEVIYNPCTATPSSDKYAKHNTILFAGAINNRKGYKDLIEAFASIAPRYPDWQLILAGSGETDEAKRFAEQHGVLSQTEFPGWITGKEKERFFEEAQIFCLPSYAEGFPMAVLDAWAYKLPVITTPVGGLPDVLDDGKNALVFTPGNKKTLATHLETLITDTKHRNSIAAESHRLASTKFNINTISEDIKRLYLSTTI